MNVFHQIGEESKKKMQDAIDALWTYTDELFHQTKDDIAMVKEGIGVDVTKLKDSYYKRVEELLREATLNTPESKWFQKGGKEGIHTENSCVCRNLIIK